MGFLKPQRETYQPQSQASPLAGDVLDLLRRSIAGGTFGSGFGPLQRGAGTAIQQYVNARQTPEMFNKLAEPLVKLADIQLGKNLGNLKEAFSIGGNRFSSSAAKGIAQEQTDSSANLQAQLSDLFMKGQDQLFNAIQAMQTMGTQDLAPLFSMAGMGILPEQTVYQDSPFVKGVQLWTNLMAAAGDAAKAAASGGAAG